MPSLNFEHTDSDQTDPLADEINGNAFCNNKSMIAAEMQAISVN